MGFTFDPLVFSGLVPSGSSGGGPPGDGHWKAPVANAAALPPTGNNQGDVRVTLDTGNIWEWNGSAWVLPAIPYSEKGAANGVATLDSVGHVPLSQLPASVVEFKGMWAASTNTPTLADGVGVSGYFYLVSDNGTVDFGSGPIVFYAGDWVLYDGTVWLRADNFTGYANAFLSNLGSPTSVNQSLIPFSGGVRDLGAPGFAWNHLYANTINDNTDNTSIDVQVRSLNDSAGGFSVTWDSRLLYDASALVSVAYNDRVLQDNAGFGTFDWQNRIFYDASGAQILDLSGPTIDASTYKISNVVDPTNPQDAATKNYVDTVGGAFANKTLSNLTSPTSINQSLLPSGSSTIDLGSSTRRWLNGYIDILRDNSNNVSINVPGHVLQFNGVGIVNWSNQSFSDSVGTEAASFNNRQLYATNGTTVYLDWSGANPSLNSHKLINVTDPTAAQDAATKNYVDSTAAINNKELFVLSGTDITNQYIDLAHVAKTNSIDFVVKGGGIQIEGASYDYSVSYTGGAGGNTRITFLNDLATGGPSALVASDVVVVKYQY